MLRNNRPGLDLDVLTASWLCWSCYIHASSSCCQQSSFLFFFFLIFTTPVFLSSLICHLCWPVPAPVSPLPGSIAAELLPVLPSLPVIP